MAKATDADRKTARVVTRWWADDTSEVQMQEDIAAAIAEARTPSADAVRLLRSLQARELWWDFCPACGGVKTMGDPPHLGPNIVAAVMVYRIDHRNDCAYEALNRGTTTDYPADVKAAVAHIAHDLVSGGCETCTKARATLQAAGLLEAEG